MLSDLLNCPVDIAAQKLLGCHLIRRIDGKDIVTRIVETEAYDQGDEASHSFRGKTKRTEIMFGPPGFAYVYFTYGMHFCINVVCQPEGHGSAVLIRAVEPVINVELIRKNRPMINKDEQLTNGPGKLTKALQIDKTFYGHDLSKPPLMLKPIIGIKDLKIVASKRVGISKNKDKLWRFYIEANHYVSRT